MTTRNPRRAPARRKKPSVRLRLKKAKTGAARQAAYRTYAAELLDNVRQRYEETPEPVTLLAADLGILPCNFYRLAKGRGWVRRNDLPPRAMPPALRLLEQAKALEAGAAITKSEAPPTPDPSPPLATLTGGGERTEPVAPVPPELSTIERLERAVLAELATIEAMRAAMGTLPQKPPGAARTVRTLSMLTQTLQHLQRLRASAMLTPKLPTRNDRDDDDDMPRDLDEFRRELARRIDAFVESRTDAPGHRADDEAAAVAEI